MIVTLSGHELEEAITLWFKKKLNQPFTVTLSDSETVECCLALGSIDLSEPEKDTDETEEVKSVKRTRRKKQETIIESKLDEPEEEPSTHYANLPKLNKEEQEQYIQLLSLLNSNPRNKNKLAIQELLTDATENLMTVVNANQAYQDWLLISEEEQVEKATKEILEPVVTPDKPYDGILDESEPVKEKEETLEEQQTRLMKEVMEESEPEETEQKGLVQSKPLFGNSGSGTKLFQFQSGVNKSGSLFPAGN